MPGASSIPFHSLFQPIKNHIFHVRLHSSVVLQKRNFTKCKVDWLILVTALAAPVVHTRSTSHRSLPMSFSLLQVKQTNCFWILSSHDGASHKASARAVPPVVCYIAVCGDERNYHWAPPEAVLGGKKATCNGRTNDKHSTRQNGKCKRAKKRIHSYLISDVNEERNGQWTRMCSAMLKQRVWTRTRGWNALCVIPGYFSWLKLVAQKFCDKKTALRQWPDARHHPHPGEYSFNWCFIKSMTDSVT